MSVGAWWDPAAAETLQFGARMLQTNRVHTVVETKRRLCIFSSCISFCADIWGYFQSSKAFTEAAVRENHSALLHWCWLHVVLSCDRPAHEAHLMINVIIQPGSGWVCRLETLQLHVALLVAMVEAFIVKEQSIGSPWVLRKNVV